MKNRIGAEELLTDPVPPAANEEFPGLVKGQERDGVRVGWDPYDVWRTRVRSAAGEAEREDDSLR